ncbi:saccharopine dehydrogenase [Bacteriovoracaceae bacterium]|nr:saccharopine dehydrogenase [Bacteriovoracaceae bacterium]
MSRTFWLRAEDKAFERRSPLTPAGAKQLIQSGAKVVVEKFEDRIFKIKEFENVGCTIAEKDSWREAPKDAFVLGLKELKEDSFELIHNHIYFAHVYKGQDGAKQVLSRYQKGKGRLFDLEFLVNNDGRRIAAFGKWAGYVGAATAIKYFYHKQAYPEKTFPQLTSFEDKQLLIDEILSLKELSSKNPKTIIIGALGRCGHAANELLGDVGLNATLWDYEETKKGGPFPEILDHHVFLNTALIMKKIPPFLDKETIAKKGQLQIICDVSCDPTGELNPIPIYDKITSWDNPILKINESLDVISVDNLPSVLPKESSEDYSDQLLPHLIELNEKESFPEVWRNSLETFENKLNETCSS